MDCVKLFYKEELLGVLTYNDPHYIFVKNENFKNKNMLIHLGLNEKREYYSSNLFSFFYKFIPSDDRVDIIRKADIDSEKDNEYEKLKKIALLDLNKNQFWIGV